ncbi:MAG: HAMP domain-containing sensor histidine kinase [Chthoniobacteraceae bacterium]
MFAAAAAPVVWLHRGWKQDTRRHDQERLSACALSIREALISEDIRHAHLVQSWRSGVESSPDYAALQRELNDDLTLKGSHFRAVGGAAWSGARLEVRLIIPVRGAAPFHPGEDLAAIPEVNAALVSEGKQRKGLLSASEPFTIPQIGDLVVTLTSFRRADGECGVIFAVLTPGDFLEPAERIQYHINPDGSLGASTVNKTFLPYVGDEVVHLRAVSTAEYERALHADALNATINLNGAMGRLRLLITPGPKFGVSESNAMARTMLGAGITVAALLSLLAWMQARQRTVLAATVRARTEELSRAQDELRAALEGERELVRLKSQFVNTVSHEFRTPLGVILSSADILAHYLDRLLPEQRAQHLGDIRNSSVQMSHMLGQVLDLGRIEADSHAFQPNPLDLVQLLGRIADESRSAFGGNVRLNFEGDLSGAAADESLLRHIFLNLLSNARKYSAADALTDLTVHRDADSAIFTVHDRGIGIPAGDLPRVFEAFARGGNVADAPGTGLGLAIVQRCLRLHGGTIHIISTEGDSTTVTVRLPLFGASPPPSPIGNPQ